MRISDVLTGYILQMLEQEGDAQIRRNELAERFGCVPSQINYVISSRFTPEQGFIVESRRGGGGYIRISRIHTDKSGALMHIINSIGTSIDNISCEVMINNLKEQSIISNEAATLIRCATSDRTLYGLMPTSKDSVRASIVKNMLISLVE